MWVNECLQGTIRFDFSPAERSVWYDLVILAGNCRIAGIISANETTPYPHSYIAGLLNIDLGLLETTLEKCKTSSRIKETERGIELVNWEHYQSEYERQKPYRENKKAARAPRDPRAAEKLSLMGIRHKAKRKELGRELSTEERFQLAECIDRELEKKYGKDAD